jgi:hypothetical protein
MGKSLMVDEEASVMMMAMIFSDSPSQQVVRRSFWFPVLVVFKTHKLEGKQQ